MNRIHYLLVGIAVLALTSCGDPKTSAPEVPNGGAVASTVSGFTALQGVTDKTTAAIKADEFDQAKTEFEKFETFWKTVEDGVKAKSSDTYKNIEDGLDTVNSELKNKQPDKAKVLTTLQALSQNLGLAAKP